MKPESLQALLLDRELGELTPEAAELLEAWLEAHPEDPVSVDRIKTTVDVARAAIERFPELARVDIPPNPAKVLPFRPFPLALAASVAILLGAAGWIGFQAGRQSLEQRVVNRSLETPAPTTISAHPWTRYVITSAPSGGLTVTPIKKQTQL